MGGPGVGKIETGGRESLADGGKSSAAAAILASEAGCCLSGAVSLGWRRDVFGFLLPGFAFLSINMGLQAGCISFSVNELEKVKKGLIIFSIKLKMIGQDVLEEL